MYTRQTLEAATEFDSDEDGVWIATHIEPHEKMRKLLFQLIVENVTITKDEINYLTESVKLPEVRSTIDEVFRGITTPRLINEILCLTQLGKICRSLMNIFDELKSGDLHLINTLLHAS